MVLIRTKSADLPATSEITPKALFLRRREVMAGAGALGLSLALPGAAMADKLTTIPGPFSTEEKQTPRDSITSYNNFYEFGFGKSDPAQSAGALTTSPWSIEVSGEIAKPGTLAIEDILKGVTLEDRVYRLRCVEGWSMVIPWVGFPLSTLIKRLEPNSRARYLRFETLLRPSEMPGTRIPLLDWPYREGLRMDEAMHPLTILAVGLYGETLPKQDGAPIRLVVPWKYGFKSIKSIVKIGFQETQPETTWNMQAPNEYGFYSNVNPEVDHPRWSQKTERRIGEWSRRPTLMFNGYGEQVAGLYAGMDLHKFF